jgi:hypothetical protein
VRYLLDTNVVSLDRRRRQLDEWLRGELALRFEARIILIDGAIADEWAPVRPDRSCTPKVPSRTGSALRAANGPIVE